MQRVSERSDLIPVLVLVLIPSRGTAVLVFMCMGLGMTVDMSMDRGVCRSMGVSAGKDVGRMGLFLRISCAGEELVIAASVIWVRLSGEKHRALPPPSSREHSVPAEVSRVSFSRRGQSRSLAVLTSVVAPPAERMVSSGGVVAPHVLWELDGWWRPEYRLPPARFHPGSSSDTGRPAPREPPPLLLHGV